MNKYSIIITLTLVVLFWNCEEIPNGTIDLETVEYIVEDISAPDLVVYSQDNKSISTSITVNNSETVNSVWFDISTINGIEKISSSNIMISSKSGIRQTYSGEVQIDENLLSGSYEILYYIEDNVRTSDENVRKVGVKQFEYLSEAENFPPKISDLDIPLEVDRGIQFVFSIKVSDPNGLLDIKEVYFELLRPDGSIVYYDEPNMITKFPMFDNGDRTNAGDQTQGDGIFSLKNSFGQTSQTGDWTFIFGAIDKSDSLSNTITSKLKVN